MNFSLLSTLFPSLLSILIPSEELRVLLKNFFIFQLEALAIDRGLHYSQMELFQKQTDLFI